MINNQDFENLEDFFLVPFLNLAGLIVHYSLDLGRTSLEALG
jgi:hypothetical protein